MGMQRKAGGRIYFSGLVAAGSEFAVHTHGKFLQVRCFVLQYRKALLLHEEGARWYFGLKVDPVIPLTFVLNELNILGLNCC